MKPPTESTAPRRLHRWVLAASVPLVLLFGSVLVPVCIDLAIPNARPALDPAYAGWTGPEIPESERHILLLMVDGLAVASLERARAEGHMPNLERLMQERPTASLIAISTFPSATSPSVQELLSGRYVELEDLPAPGAVHAFDRDALDVIRYVTSPDAWQWPVPTLFDVVADRSTITVFEGRWDGPQSILTQYNMLEQALLEVVGAGELSAGDEGPVQAYVRVLRRGERPTISLVVLNEFDIAAHFHGPGSPEARRALARTDRLLGDVLEALTNRSLLDTTTLVVFGDHGMAPSGRHVDLVPFFGKRGLNAVDVSTATHVLLRERLGTYWTTWADAILVAGGSNVTQVYLKDREHGWRPSSSPERAVASRALADGLVRLEGVDQVLWAEAGGGVRVLTAEAGEARVLMRGSGSTRRFAYVVADGATVDPFGYLEAPASRLLVSRANEVGDPSFHDLTAWFDATAASAYPGAVPLLPKAFRVAQFTGDLMVTAKRGYTFLRGQKGDHGNLDRAAMLTPLILNGPGVTSCEESHQPRLVDLFASVAVLLGATADDPAFAELDGRVLDCVSGSASGEKAPGPED